MSKVLVVATGRQTRGGITAVVKAHEQGPQWQRYCCHWVQTHRDGEVWRKLIYLFVSIVDFVCRLPFCDIVHIHCSQKISSLRKLIFFVMARLLRKKTIVHFHLPGEQYLDDLTCHRELVYMFSHADRVLVLSSIWKKLLEEKVGISDNVQVIYNPCPRVIEGKLKGKVILFAGTLNQRKGYDVLLRAFARVADRYPDWRLVYAGNGEVDEAKHLSDQLKISRQVEFLGWVDAERKEKAFQSASIFCLPSYGEGFPMAVLDAWAYGLPVVTTPVGGIPDVAKDGENMLLFAPGDVEMLARQLDRLMSDEALRERISAASRQFAQNEFNLDSINRQLGDLYEELAAR